MSTTDSALDQRLKNPIEVVTAFLDRLRAGDVDGAAVLMSADIRYRNASLPTITTRERVRRIFAATLGRPGISFDFVNHSIAAAERGSPARAAASGGNGATVLTERTDALIAGRLRVQLWVCGRFDVQDGEITAWTDYFDWGNLAVAGLRGLVGWSYPLLRPSFRRGSYIATRPVPPPLSRRAELKRAS